MKRKEHPTIEEFSSKKFNNSCPQLETDAWSVICEYTDGKSLVNLFCLSKEIQMKLIETFSSLVSSRVKENRDSKILGLSYYIAMDPMLLLLHISGPCFQQNHVLKNNGIQSKDYYSYVGDTLQVSGGLKFKVEDECCLFVDAPSISFFGFLEHMRKAEDNLFDKCKLDFMLFSLSEQIVSMGKFQLTERFKTKMEFMTRLYGYKTGDVYPQDHLIPVEKFQELFLLEHWDLFECVKQDIAGIFVVNRVDYGLFLLGFFGKSQFSKKDVLVSILNWIRPSIGYSKSPFPLFTLILFTINALYSFYFSNFDIQNKKMTFEYSLRNTNENIDTCKRIMRATNYLIVILKASNLYPQSLQFNGQWDFMEIIQEIQFIQQVIGVLPP